MADFDEDISIDSDDDEYLDNDNSSDKNSYSQNGKRFATDAERRAHHNALERKRRDQIKTSFIYLRDSIPSLKGEKPSRAQILKKASEYIDMMDRKRQSHRQDIVRLKKQIRALERAGHRLAHDDSPEVNVDSDSEESADSSSTEETTVQIGSRVIINLKNNSE